METLEITLISSCPMNCTYCCQSLLKTKYNGNKFFTLNKFKDIIDKIPNNVRIDFSGFAEPFIVPDAIDMIEYASIKHKITIFTTCMGMKREDVDRISFIKNLEHLELHLQDENMRFKPHKDDIINYIREKIPNHSEMNMSTSNVSLHDRAGNCDIGLHFNNIGNISCQGTINPRRGVLLPNGDVVLCCNDYGLKHKLGNLFEQTYEEIYNSNEYKKIVKGFTDESLNTLCRKCYYARK